MARLSPGVKEELISRIAEGWSINKISKSLELGKSTIYYYYKKIKGKKYQEPVFECIASKEEGEIVGIFTGDGSQYFRPKTYHYEVNVHFGGHNREYANYVKKLFERHFHATFHLGKELSGVFRLRVRSKRIFHYFWNYLEYRAQCKHATVFLKNLNLPDDFKKGFLRGVFDTDGCLSQGRSGKLQAYYGTTSPKLALQIQYLLFEQGICSGIRVEFRKHYKPFYRVSVLRRSVSSFLKTIAPFKGRNHRI